MPECAFCDYSGKLTLEHIMSGWIEEVFPGKTKVEYQDGTGRSTQFTKERMDYIARVVCQKCNNGWMSDLEREHAIPALKPLIIRNPPDIEITKSVARSISLFSFKTALIVDINHAKNGIPFFSKRQRYDFRANQAIPSQVTIWICGNYGTRKSIDLHSGYFSGNLMPTYPLQVYVCTFAIGPLTVQVFSAKHFGETRLYPIPGFEAVACPLWPTMPEHITWPLPNNLSGKRDFDLFSMRWNSIGHDLRH